MPRLERYLRANGAAIPRTTLRYAIERFPEARRRALLAATRRQFDGVVRPSGRRGQADYDRRRNARGATIADEEDAWELKRP